MNTFAFKQFKVEQTSGVHAVGTDAMVLGALINANHPVSILDIGTGTGVLSLMMAQVYPTAGVTAIDINRDAINIADQNFTNSSFANRLRALHIDLVDFSHNRDQLFELIISNPPYFEQSTPAVGEGRNNARHQISLALENLLIGIEQLLAENGSVWLILPVDQADKCIQKSSLFPSQRIQIFGKPGKHVRDVICLKRTNEDCKVSSLTIREETGDYTEEYKSLTLEFHGVTL